MPNEPIVFDHSDSEYFKWLDLNPQGFVVAIKRRGSSSYLRFHKATCGSIRDAKNEKSPGGYTERVYIKVGSLSAQALRAWVSSERPKAIWNACSRCKPG